MECLPPSLPSSTVFSLSLLECLVSILGWFTVGSPSTSAFLVLPPGIEEPHCCPGVWGRSLQTSYSQCRTEGGATSHLWRSGRPGWSGASCVAKSDLELLPRSSAGITGGCQLLSSSQACSDGNLSCFLTCGCSFFGATAFRLDLTLPQCLQCQKLVYEVDSQSMAWCCKPVILEFWRQR